jgi:DNA repair exonuclease SbcCD ATPase subunit
VRSEMAELRDWSVRLGAAEAGLKRLDEQQAQAQRARGEAERAVEQRLCTLEHGMGDADRAHAQLRLAVLGQTHATFGAHNSLADHVAAVRRACDEAADELRARGPAPAPAQPSADDPVGSRAESALAASVSRLSDEVRAQRAELGQLVDASSRSIGPQIDERMAEYRSTMRGMDERWQAVDATVHDHARRIDASHERMHAMEEDVTKLRRLRKLLESQQADVGEKVVEVGGSLSEMQRKVEAIEQDQSRRFIQ